MGTRRTLDYRRPDRPPVTRRPFAATLALTPVGVAGAAVLLFAVVEHGASRHALLLAMPAAHLVFTAVPITGRTVLLAAAAVVAQWAGLGLLVDGLRLLLRRT